MTKNSIYLRRRRKVLLAEGSETLPITYLASAFKNIESLGFVFAPELVERLQTLTERDFVAFYGSCVETLRQMVGANVEYTPMYPNFPSQVMEMEEAELYLNALMHYLGDWLGYRILPQYEKEERPALTEDLSLTPIGLGEEEEFLQIPRKLIGANTSISPQDKEDLEWFVQEYKQDCSSILPVDIPHKENLSTITMLLLKYTDAAELLLTRYFKTTTDVLRLATALSDGDVSLATNTRFRNFKRPERRLLLGLLERCREREEDMLRYKGRWKRLGERLHPGEHRKRYPKTARAFDVLRNSLPVSTFHSRLEAALEAKDTVTALALLKTRPGELARKLDHLLRLTREHASILKAFADTAEDVATPVLLQVMTHFAHRNESRELRSVFPKGNAAKVVTLENTLPPMSPESCERIVESCRKALLARFGELESLGKCYLDESLKEHLVPFSQRSASKALRTLVRGSSLDLPEGDTIRFFLWWKEGKVDGKATGRVDLDLSSIMYDEDWNYKEHISYTNLRSAKYRAFHSGDITSAPQGACEFIDLDIPSILKYGGRYVVTSVLSFTRQSFVSLPECHAGWMIRQEPNSGEIFEPATVQDKIDLTADTRIAIPVILDLKERKAIWADLALKSNPSWHVNVEGNRKSFVHMGKALTSLVKTTLYDLFSLHIQARGTQVASPEEAETVFSLHEGITPWDIETIMADYL